MVFVPLGLILLQTQASGESTHFICQLFPFIGVFSPGLVGEGVVVGSAVVVGEGVVVGSAVVVVGSCACVQK